MEQANFKQAAFFMNQVVKFTLPERRHVLAKSCIKKIKEKKKKNRLSKDGWYERQAYNYIFL